MKSRRISLKGRFRLSPTIKVRREEFGGLIMDYGEFKGRESKLYFVKSPLLMTLILSMDGSQTLEELMKKTLGINSLTEKQLNKIFGHLTELYDKGVICET